MACNSFCFLKFEGKWILLRDFRPLLTKKPPPAFFLSLGVGNQNQQTVNLTKVSSPVDGIVNSLWFLILKTQDKFVTNSRKGHLT